MAKKEPDVPLDNERHEMFARCLAGANDPLVCYFGVGYNRDPVAAMALVRLPEIKARTLVLRKKRNPHAWKNFVYPDADTRKSKA